MNKIVLITTEGCEGCSIMRKSIDRAIVLTKKEIEREVKDMKEVGSKYLRTFGIRDFPTTLFFKDDKLLRKEVGTRPYIVVLRWIDIDFK